MAGFGRWVVRGLLSGLFALTLGTAGVAWGQPVAPADGPAAGQAKVADPAPPGEPLGQFLTLPGVIDDATLGRVSRTALALQARAQQEQRRAVLALEVVPGSSPFHQVRGLAKFLSADVPGVRTIAWVPGKVTGNHVIIALACQEIVMAPDAELGDISLGQALDPDEQAFVVNLANRRRNNALSEALLLGMLDRQRELLWVRLEPPGGAPGSSETRVVLRSGLEDLQRAGMVIPEVRTIKEAGTPGVFHGDRCRALHILAAHVADSRQKVAELYGLPSESLRETAITGEAPRTIRIAIDGPIEPQLEQYVQRQISRAVAGGANLIIFEIDSPGGMLGPSLNLAATVSELKRRKVHAVAWIPKAAYSGAAIIALGCDEIYLAPDATIGDAEPIELKADGQFERVPEKLVSALAQQMEHLADLKGRPKALAGAMADKDLRVFQVKNKQNGKIWYLSEAEIHAANEEWEQVAPVPECENNRLLTVSGQRAHELRLAETPVADFNELKSRLGIPTEDLVPLAQRTWVDELVYVLNLRFITGLLLLAGFVALYFEAHFPSGLFGIIAALCFGLFFWSKFLGGSAGWLEVLLFLLGAGCLALEIFVVPGFGVFGLSGILLCLASLILAMQTFVIPHTMSDLYGVGYGVLTLSLVGIGMLGFAGLVGRYLPSIPFLNQMVLEPPGFHLDDNGPRLRPDLVDEPANPMLQRDVALVGRRGQTMTVLRPSGRARIGEDYLDVVSEGVFIPPGRTVEVIEVVGNRVVVRELT
ncbi:MAG: NfeD family protein [Planctomycetaceae bacterium]